MEEYSLLQEQRTEAKSVMVRIFRFRTRRGIGVFYMLLSLLLLVVAALFWLPVSPSLAVAATLAAAIAVVFGARAAGFQGFDRMAYSMAFLERGEEFARESRKWYTRPAFLRLVTILWGAAFIVAAIEGLSSLSFVFFSIYVAQAVLLRVFALSRNKNRILETRPEDWATVAAVLIIILSSVAIGTALWGILLAVPVCLIAGLKSLYDSQKELSRVAF